MRLPRLLAAVVVLEVVMLIAHPAEAARWGKKDKIVLESWLAQEATYWDDFARKDLKCIVLTLNVRNKTDKVVKAWRANCVVKDPYDKEIFTFVANGDAKEIADGAVEAYDFYFRENYFSGNGDYEQMREYNLKLIKLEFRDVEVAK